MERSVLTERSSLKPINCSKSPGKQLSFAPFENARGGVWPWEVPVHVSDAVLRREGV